MAFLRPTHGDLRTAAYVVGAGRGHILEGPLALVWLRVWQELPARAVVPLGL